MFFPIRLVSGFVDDLCSLRTTANQTRDPRLDWSSDSARVVRRRRHLPVPFSLVCTYSAPSLYEVSHLEKGSFPAVKRRPLFSLLPVRVLKRSLYSSPFLSLSLSLCQRRLRVAPPRNRVLRNGS